MQNESARTSRCALFVSVYSGLVLVVLLHLHALHWRTLHTVPHLPTLRATAQSRETDREWHRYFERVYGGPVETDVDLNRFNWFYHHAPLRLYGVTPVPMRGLWFVNVQQEGVLWYEPHRVIGSAYADHGLFVVRHGLPRPRRDEAMIEVLHHVCPSEEEKNASVWFYHLVGSGVYVRVPSVTSYATFGTDNHRMPELTVAGEGRRTAAYVASVPLYTGYQGLRPCDVVEGSQLTACKQNRTRYHLFEDPRFHC